MLSTGERCTGIHKSKAPMGCMIAQDIVPCDQPSFFRTFGTQSLRLTSERCPQMSEWRSWWPGADHSHSLAVGNIGVWFWSVYHHESHSSFHQSSCLITLFDCQIWSRYETGIATNSLSSNVTKAASAAMDIPTLSIKREDTLGNFIAARSGQFI